MGSVKFNLKNKNANGKTLIYMIVYYDGMDLKLSTRTSVDPKYWNDKKQRVKLTLEFNDVVYVNDRLDNLEKTMSSLLKRYRDNGYYPDPTRVKSDFLKLDGVPLKSKKSLDFWDYFEDFVAFKKTEKPDIRDYDNSLRKHLLKTDELMGRKITFDMISNSTSGFVHVWHNYLTFDALNKDKEPGLATNTIGKLNKNLKAYLNWCFESNITSRFSLKLFPTIMEEVDKVYVTEEEIVKIETTELDDDFQKTVRDLFIIGCETAFRFSDFIRIDKNFIQDNKIHFRPKKTSSTSSNNKVIIPISERLKNILSKYNYDPPKFPLTKITDFNKALREICKKAELNTQFVKHRKIAGKEIQEVCFKYNEVSSHTCRRTFCTLKFLKGMPAQAIMKFSGHKTEKNFLRYLKLDAELTAEKYKEYF